MTTRAQRRKRQLQLGNWRLNQDHFDLGRSNKLVLVLSSAGLARNCKIVAPFSTTCIKDTTTVFTLHTGTESVLVDAATTRWLISTLHDCRFFPLRERKCKQIIHVRSEISRLTKKLLSHHLIQLLLSASFLDNYRLILARNSSLSCVPNMCLRKNSIASSGFMSARCDLSTLTRVTVAASSKRSSLLVDDLGRSIAGYMRLLASDRSS